MRYLPAAVAAGWRAAAGRDYPLEMTGAEAFPVPREEAELLTLLAEAVMAAPVCPTADGPLGPMEAAAAEADTPPAGAAALEIEPAAAGVGTDYREWRRVDAAADRQRCFRTDPLPAQPRGLRRLQPKERRYGSWNLGVSCAVG